MSVKNFYNRHDDIRVEAQKSWAFLRKLPEYKADFQNNNQVEMNKYGFYPLIDPKIKEAPHEFFLAFGKPFGFEPFDGSVVFLDEAMLWTQADKKGRASLFKANKPSLPDKLSVEIDPQKPTAYVIDQIKRQLDKIKKAYDIKDSRPRTADLNRQYQARILRNLGLTDKQIEAKLHGLPDEIKSDSRRKKVHRILKKSSPRR